MVVGHSSGHFVKPKYIIVHLPMRSFFVNAFCLDEKNSKSDICFGSLNRNRPLTSNSSSESVLGVVSLLINKPRTVIMKIAISSKFLFIPFMRQDNDLAIKLQI